MDAATIKQTTDILTLCSYDTQLKKVASTEGGEWAGSCPFCGGEDRFRVQPYHPDGGKWYCRGCGDNHWHDAIDYVMKRDNVEFREALKVLGGEDKPPAKNDTQVPAIDRKKWNDTAHEFAHQCAEQLWNDESEKARVYLHGRGLSDDTLLAWRIGFNPIEGYGNPGEWGIPDGDKIFIPRGIVIPCYSESALHYIKIRKSAGNPKYHILHGGKPFLYGAQTYRRGSMAFLFESELDALLAMETGLNVGMASMPAGQKLHVEYQPYFDSIEELIIAYDDDQPGRDAADKLVKLSKHFYKAQPLPTGKDLTEYYKSMGDIGDILDWLLAQLDLIGANNGA